MLIYNGRACSRLSLALYKEYIKMKLCELKNNLLQDLSNFNGDFGVVISFGFPSWQFNTIRFIYGNTEKMDEFNDELDWEFLIFNDYPYANFSYKIKDRNDVNNENFSGTVIFSRN